MLRDTPIEKMQEYKDNDFAPSLKCGHTAFAIYHHPNGKSYWSCVICDCVEVVPAPDLTGRKARCDYYGTKIGRSECDICNKTEDRICRCERPSDTKLAFFEHHPDKEFDRFYCGCESWD